MSIQQDVDRGLEIVAQVEKLNAELKAINDRLEKAGLSGPQIPLQDEDREGKKYLAKGTERIVPVILTADLIAGSFTDGSPMHTAAYGAAGPDMAKLYKRQVKWESRIDDGKKFRATAAEVLTDRAPKFITAVTRRDKAGIPVSKIVVAWNEARPIVEG